jgi:LysR family transcriptional regulator, regulator of abg operon
MCFSYRPTISNMKLSQLRNVRAIVEHGSLRAAARALGLSQPALSRSVQELERELGTALFERRRQGVTLTPAGDVLVRRANVILGDVRRAREEVQQISGSSQGTVVAGLSFAAHVALLPHTLRRFRKRYPQVFLRLIEGFLPSLETGLKDGSIDFYAGPRHEGTVSDGLITEKLFNHDMSVVCRAGHPLARSLKSKAAVSLADLGSCEWVTAGITHLADDELGEVFEKNQLPPRKIVSQTHSALSLVMTLISSDLLAMVPLQFTNYPLAREAIISIPVKEHLPGPMIVLVKRSGLSLTPAAQYFVDLLQSQNG